MSTEGMTPPKPKRSFGRALSAPFRGRSLAARAALVVGLLLVVLVAVAWIVFSLNPVHVPWRHAMSWTRVTIILVLVVLTPLTLYWALRLWLVGYHSRFPEIDRAWDAGLRALARNGISLRSTPVFLILGSPSPELEESLMHACGREFAVRGVPEGPGPLHWYASDEGIYLVCSEVGWLSRVNRVVHQQVAKESSPSEPIGSEG